MPVVFPEGLARSLPPVRVVAIVPARFQSIRLPGKPLALIDERPMIEHVFRRAASARTPDVVLVATDDERIANAVDRFGGTAVMTHDRHRSATERLAEVVAAFACEYVVNVQGDEPLLEPDAIDDAVRLLQDRPDAQMSTLRHAIHDDAEFRNPSVVKVVIDGAGNARYFSRAPIPFTRPGQPKPVAWKHIGLYVYRRDVLLEIAGLPETALERAEGLEQLRALEHGFTICTRETRNDTIGVDTPEDLERVRQLVAAGAHP